MKKVHYIYLAVIAALLGALTSLVISSVRMANRAKAEIAQLTAQRDKNKSDLEAMTKRYLEESAENSAVTSYLANIPRKMNFAEPFGLKLREVINKERILPSGIYIREGQYDDFEISDTVVDKDTMAFAKLSGMRVEETEEKELPSYMATLEKRIQADLAAAKYPFKVTHRVWQEGGIVNFEIVDAEMYAKMEQREAKTRDQSVAIMKTYRDK